MTIHLVTFSDESMSRSRELCVESSRRHGVANAFPWTQDQIIDGSGLCRVSDDAARVVALMVDFQSMLKDRWSRGVGFWSWKPFVIAESMKACDQNDVIVYADAGVEFIAPVSHIINRMDQDIFLFGNNWEHAHWCKRDVAETVWPDYRIQTVRTQEDYEYRSNQMWARFGKQVQASVIFFRVSDYTRKFVKEWLHWCLFEGGRLIDDSPSRLPNHPEFREHRHDQAILTTMAYREGIKPHWWPAMYNDGAFVYEKLPEYAADDYPVLFHHHRRRNHEWEDVA